MQRRRIEQLRSANVLRLDQQGHLRASEYDSLRAIGFKPIDG
jgi:hypothetical protein